jgi:hypothetical protein
VFFVWSSRSGILPSLDDGESGARARLAFRDLGRSALASVATSMLQLALADFRISTLATMQLDDVATFVARNSLEDGTP